MSSLITSSPNKQRKNRFTPPQLIEILLIHQSPKFVIEINKIKQSFTQGTGDRCRRASAEPMATPRLLVRSSRHARHAIHAFGFLSAAPETPLEIHEFRLSSGLSFSPRRISKASGTPGAHRKGLRLTCRSSAGLHQPNPQIGCAARHALGADFFCGGPSHG